MAWSLLPCSFAECISPRSDCKELRMPWVVWEGSAHSWGECRGQRGLAALLFWVWLMSVCWSVFVRAGMPQTLFELFSDQINQHFRRGLLQIHKLWLGQENTNCLQFSFYPFSPPSISVFPHWIIFHLSGNVVKCLHEFQWKCHCSKNAWCVLYCQVLLAQGGNLHFNRSLA